MNKIIFATHNNHKLHEIRSLLNSDIKICSLADLGFYDDVPETQATLDGNAQEKAQFVYKKFAEACFADDTGLEIEALNNAPGVYSARYAGEEKDAKKNMQKVLHEMQNIDNRKARFRCVIALILDGETHMFEGVVNGEILREPIGTDGFGYDPIFRPNGYDISFAQMPLDEKNRISHRGLAVKKLVEFLNK